CGVLSDQSAWCWGYNSSGQVGNNTTDTMLIPTAVPGFGPGSTVELAAGYSHTCALKTDGSVWCWGSNYAGQLGDGTTVANPLPAQVTGLGPGTALSIGAGSAFTCVIKTDHSVWCWGSNSSGQLGDGSNDSSSVPVAVAVQPAMGSEVVQLSCGTGFNCIIDNEDGVWCWGNNASGQLGVGHTTDSNIPLQIDSDYLGAGNTPLIISTGGNFACAYIANNKVYCWGSNSNGQLGDGTTISRPYAQGFDIPNPSTVVSLSAGSYSACLVRNSGSTWCWGGNSYGQLGDGTTTDRYIMTQVTNLVDDTSLKVFVGQYTSCTIRTNGSGWCWGNGGYGQLANGETLNYPTPQEMSYPF
ncbi:RCC1 repeat-containing protein, partial [Myxococcota bacterium]|nr:RCC1 repeat-containing protein [Myxococcota bacterium]MBU1537410.1 RCC1 repeat-containing protein [Myxococcota bacterium]